MTDKLDGYDERALEAFSIAEAYAKENMNAFIEPAHILKALLHKNVGLIPFVERRWELIISIFSNGLTCV